jgi:hypothetical protein
MMRAAGRIAALHEARVPQLRDGRHEQRRRERQVVDALGLEAALVLDDVEARAERRQPLLGIDLGCDEEQGVGKRLPRGVRRSAGARTS